MYGLITPLLMVLVFVFGVLSGNATIFLFAFVFVIILGFLSIKIVSPNTVKTVEFLGKYNRILRPGINFLIPFVEWTRHQDLFRKNFSANVESISSDNVTVQVGINVIYYVVDNRDDSENGNIYKSIYSINNFTQALNSTIDEQLRALISTFGHKEIFSKREEIGQNIKEYLRETLAGFGYTLDSIQVRDITLERSVMDAMNRIVAAEKLREAAISEAEAEKIKLVKAAEADKESKILIGQGMAGQRMEIAKGFKESVDLIRSADDDLDGDKILQFLLDSSRIETLNSIGSKDSSKLIYLNENLEGKSMSNEAKLIAGSDIIR